MGDEDLTTADGDDGDDSGHQMVVPFVVCVSNGGTLDDEAFVAGFQAGRIDQALQTAAVTGAETLRFIVYSTLVQQLDLIAMNRGWPHITRRDFPDHPEWTEVCFSTRNPHE